MNNQLEIFLRRADNRRAFTIIELLVVIGVIGVLLSLTLPALRSARDAGRTLVCVANLHSLGQTMVAYNDAHDGKYPFVRNGNGKLFPTPTYPGDTSAATIPNPFSLEIQWTILMFDIAPWDEYFASWLCPGAPRDPARPWDGTNVLDGDGALVINNLSSYSYSTSFVASPSLWSGHSEADESLLRPTLASEVAHPSNKVLMWDSEMAHLSVKTAATLDRRPMLFTDGHAAVMRLSEAAEPVVNPFTGEARKLVDTPHGVDGVDY